MAKKKAGIQSIELDMVPLVPSGPVLMVTEQEFKLRSAGRDITCYGIIRAMNTNVYLSGCVGVLPTEKAEFECTFSTREDFNYSTESVISRLVRHYEVSTKDKAIKPITSSSGVIKRDKSWLAVVAVAIIASDRNQPVNLDYDKRLLTSIQGFE
jgi:hypothetical protein